MNLNNNYKPTTKIAWITGASTGIGAAVSLRLAKEGWTVAVTARSVDHLKALSAAAQAHSGIIMPFPGDVTKPEEMVAIVETIENSVGVINLVILNAGMYKPDTLNDFTADNFRKHFETNVFGVANCLEPVLDRFKKRKAGHIAITASVAGYRGLPRSLSYGPTKAALINMAEALAVECLGTGIKVQVINPGFVKTPMTDANDFPMPMLMGVDRAADRLISGLKSDRFEIVFPWMFCFLTKFFGNILPGRIYIKAVSNFRKKK